MANVKKREPGKNAEFLNWLAEQGQSGTVDGSNIRIPQKFGQDVLLPANAEYELPRFHHLSQDGID